MINTTFFPNFLKTRYQLKKQAETRAPFPLDQVPTYRELLDIYREEKIDYIPQLFWEDPNSTDEIAIEAMYKQATCSDLRETQKWICKHTLFTINIDNYLSIGVYTRIATSMLNKLEQEGVISKELNIYYHDNFVKNLAVLNSAMSLEELPF
jgi:hypothetical protein